MKRQEYFFTAQPVVTDDDGHLGYLWQGLVYTERDFGMSDFDPFLKTDSLFYTPDGAIDEAKRMVIPGPQPIDPSLIDKWKTMDVGDENAFEKWREEMLKELEKDPNFMSTQDDFEWIAKEAESKGPDGFEYLSRLQKFYAANCEFCGSQRCTGVYDREWREGCHLYKKEFRKEIEE